MTTVHLIRHAKAKNRLEWEQPDRLRPLTKRGRREADAIAARLEGEGVSRLVASPYVRCLQTLEPLAVSLDLAIETTELLAEGADGAAATDLLLLLSGAGVVACCTHGDVLFDVLAHLGARGVGPDGPRDAPVASTWVLELEDGVVVAARFVAQPPR